jgi:hypothetical protein
VTASAYEQHRSGRLGPALVLGGAGILLYRTIALILSEARRVLQRWVIALTFAEMAIDVLTMIASARWLVTRSTAHAHLPLRAGAVAALLHAARVLVFVVGRTGPWRDLDVRPEHREDHDERWTWAQVVFAGTMSILGVVGVGVVWLARRQAAAPPRC